MHVISLVRGKNQPRDNRLRSLHTDTKNVFLTLPHTHTHTRTHARTHAHAHTRAHARTHTYMYAHTDTHTRTHTYMYAHTDTHTHTHTYTLMNNVPFHNMQSYKFLRQSRVEVQHTYILMHLNARRPPTCPLADNVKMIQYRSVTKSVAHGCPAARQTLRQQGETGQRAALAIEKAKPDLLDTSNQSMFYSISVHNR